MVPQYSHVGHRMEKGDLTSSKRLAGGVEDGRVRSPMDARRVDWAFDAPIPCPTCGRENIAKLALLKARDSIRCSCCGMAIDLTDPSTRAFVEELSDVVASLSSGGTAKR
jgi:transcription elongation factor Elf1